MPFVKPKTPPPTHFQASLGAAVGRVNDFWALAYCPELDELEQRNNRAHDRFTFIFHHVGPDRIIEARYPERLDGLWQRDDGVLFAAGARRALLEFEPDRMVEVPLNDVPGIFTSLWGHTDGTLFGAGGYGNAPFVLEGRRGHWQLLPLPDGAGDVHGICGFSDEDVYFVGKQGQVHHFDGQTVRRLKVPVPTSHILTGIARLDDTRMVVSGYHGALLVGNASGFRHLITNTRDPILTVATLAGEAYYCAESSVWSTDGAAPPAIAIDFDAAWVSGLADGLVLGGYTSAVVYQNGVSTPLDVKVEARL